MSLRRALACCCCCCCCCYLAAGELPAALEPGWADALDHGSIRGFPSYTEANALLDRLARLFPQSLEKRVIGASYQKRPIHAYILGTPAARSRSCCPQVLLTALTHAREPASLTVLLYFLGHTLERYSQGDPGAVYVLETREIWLVPFVNPDGYIENEKLGSKTIRKNRRPTCIRGSDSGVDINRNFGFHWSQEFSRCNEEFQGSHPFSEPETQALKKICEEQHFRAAMNFHTFGGMLTHPFNFAKHPQLPEDDRRIYHEIAKVFGWKKFGPAIRTVGYTAPGESDDWMYGVRKIISMSPEVGPESGDFWPPAREIAGINHRNFERTLYIVRKAGLELGVEWTHRPAQPERLPANVSQLNGGAPLGELELRLSNQGLSESAGEALGVAVAGAVGPSPAGPAAATAAAPAALLLAEAGGSWPAELAAGAGGASAGVLAFRLPALQRRSQRRLRLLAGRAWEPSGPRALRLCAAELLGPAPARPGGPADAQICHCSAPAQLPAAALRAEASAAPNQAPAPVFALAAGAVATTATLDAALCRAAATAGQGARPTQPSPAVAAPAGKGARPSPAVAAPAGKGPAAAPLPVASPQAGAAEAISAAAAPPTGGRSPLAPPLKGTAAAVLAPAFEATDGEEAAAADLLLLALCSTAFALGVCLAWQAVVGRQLRPLVATAGYRRPHAPPPLPATPSTRRAGTTSAAGDAFEEDSMELGSPQVKTELAQ